VNASNIMPFLGAFPKLRKATIRFVMSVFPARLPVCPSVRTHGTNWLPLDGFYVIWYLNYFENLLRNFKFHSYLNRITVLYVKSNYSY